MPTNFLYRNAQTAIVWGQPTASGVTRNLSLNNLTPNACQMGQAFDLGAFYPTLLELSLEFETGSAPAALAEISTYLTWSRNGTDWPGLVTGSDGAYTIGTNDINLRPLGMVYQWLARPVADTVQRYFTYLIVPRARWVAPVVHNRMGVGLPNRTPAANNLSRVILTPSLEVAKP